MTIQERIQPMLDQACLYKMKIDGLMANKPRPDNYMYQINEMEDELEKLKLEIASILIEENYPNVIESMKKLTSNEPN